MKKLIAILALLSMFRPLIPVRAALTTSDKQGFPGPNLLWNAGFENKTQKWTSVNGVLSVDTTNLWNGTQSGLDTASSVQASILQDVTPGSGGVVNMQTASVSMVAACVVKTSMTNVQVSARTGGTVVASMPVPSTGTWQMVPVNFVGPANGTSVGVSVGMTSSGTGTFNVDQCYVGPAYGFNLSQVSQSIDLGTMLISGCSAGFISTTTGGPSTTADVTATGCTYTGSGQLTAPTSGWPGFQIASLGPGTLQLDAVGSFDTVAAHHAYFQFFDGTNPAKGVADVYSSATANTNIPSFSQNFTYTTPQTNLNVRIRESIDSAGGTAAITASGVYTLAIHATYFPTQSQTVQSVSTTPASWSGHFTGNSSGWSTTSATITDFSAGSGATLTADPNPRNITCSAASGSLPGVTCSLPIAANYWVCADGMVTQSASGAATGVQLVDSNGNTLDTWGSSAGTAGQGLSYHICGKSPVSSASSVTFKVKGGSNGTGTEQISSYFTNYQLAFTITNGDQPLSAPFLVGSVTSNSAGALRTDAARIVNNCTALNTGSPSIATQTGNLFQSPSSSGCNAVGDLTLSFTTAFAAAPICTCTASNFGTGGSCGWIGVPSTTGLRMFNFGTSGSGQSTNDAEIICTGSR